MATRLNPYINFEDDARAALEFYHGVFGGELQVNTFGETGGAAGTPIADLVMHGQLETAAGHTIMASDTPPGMTRTVGNNMTVSLSGNDAAELRGYWEGLAAGGKVETPLEKQVWGDEFGQLTDRFGVQWLVNITQR